MSQPAKECCRLDIPNRETIPEPDDNIFGGFPATFIHRTFLLSLTIKKDIYRFSIDTTGSHTQ